MPMPRSTRVCSIENCGKRHVGLGYCRGHLKRFHLYGDALAGGTEKGAPLRWLLSALEIETDECLDWPFGKISGYGSINYQGRSMLVSTLICEKAHGPRPEGGYEAAHSCGRPICCNKSHLRWATFVQNNADKVLHGTYRLGEDVGTSIYSDAQCLEMISLRQQGLFFRQIAEKFGADMSNVAKICKGKSRAYLHPS